MLTDSDKSTGNLKESLKRNKREFIETFLTIKDKGRNIVPFKLNPIQADMATTRTNSDIYVKPRQVGASEYFIADVLCETVIVPGTNSVLIAYEEETTKRLLSKADFFFNRLDGYEWDGLPTRYHDSEFKKTFRYYEERNNPKSSQFAPPSTLYIASARSFVMARGDAYHNIIADEFAFWPYPDKLVEVLGGRTPDSRIIILSTPNGEENQFCEMYRTACEKMLTNENVYTPHFYTWLQHPEYVLSPDDTLTLSKDRVSPLEDITPEEYALMEGVWQASEEQIRWRRYKIAEVEQLRRMGETRVLFSQEFPEDDTTCFITFGDMVYDGEILAEKLKTAFPAPHHMFNVDIWELPQEGQKYLISVDPGVGKQSMTAITVWRFEFDESGDEKAIHCATCWGLYGAERTNDCARNLGKFYNWGTISTEANIETLAILLKGYPNLYRRRDLQTGKPSLDIGWVTTAKTKPIMVNELMMMLPNMEIHDERIIKEIRNMRYDNNERVRSAGFDDLHDSAAIAMITRQSRPMTTGLIFNYGRKK